MGRGMERGYMGFALLCAGGEGVLSCGRTGGLMKQLPQISRCLGQAKTCPLPEYDRLSVHNRPASRSHTRLPTQPHRPSHNAAVPSPRALSPCLQKGNPVTAPYLQRFVTSATFLC